MLLEGGSALELSDWTIAKCGLRSGGEVDEQTIENIKSTEALTQAKNLAINYVSFRQRSSKEIIDHLAKKGFTRECAEDVARQLQSLHMVNDLEFARAFVRDRVAKKTNRPDAITNAVDCQRNFILNDRHGTCRADFASKPASCGTAGSQTKNTNDAKLKTEPG